jgi:hypothetical protein
MKEWGVLPPALLKDKPELKRWLAKGLAYARSLPPKPVRDAKSSRSTAGARARSSRSR